MTIQKLSASAFIGMLSVSLTLVAAQPSLAQAPAAPAIGYPSPSISLAEARAIIDGAIAFAREGNMRYNSPVLDVQEVKEDTLTKRSESTTTGLDSEIRPGWLQTEIYDRALQNKSIY